MTCRARGELSNTVMNSDHASRLAPRDFRSGRKWWGQAPRWLLGLALFWFTGNASAPAATLYSTGFEASEGFIAADLVGQKGWAGAGSGGNGIVTDFPGSGQQAYIGYAPPLPGDSSLFVYYPLNQAVSNAQFSVTMAVYDSSNTNYDDFYWSVFNRQGDQFFSLDFDNYSREVRYYLDGTNAAVSTGLAFTNGTLYQLTMNLDWARNRWSATFGGALLATNQPITTTGLPLNLGDIDAVWGVYDTNAPGNNYMVFDNYRVTGTAPPPQLKVLGRIANAPVIRLSGYEGASFALEASTNLVNWTSLKTNVTAGGFYDYTDAGAAGLSRRFYRGRWAP